MLRSPHLATSPGESLKGIFSFTELSIGGKQAERTGLALPNIRSMKSSSEVNSPIAKSKKKAGHQKAASVTRLPTASSRMLSSAIEGGKLLRERLNKEAQELETSPLVTREIAFAKNIVIDSKAGFDELRLLRSKKEAFLKVLHTESEKLSEQLSPESSFALSSKFDHLIQLAAEFDETMQGCRNETHYSETLQHMIETRKVSLLAKMSPLRKLKEALHSVDRELQSACKREMEVRVEAESVVTKNKGLEEDRDGARVSAGTVLKEKTERYKDKQKLMMYLERERADINDQKRLNHLEHLSAHFHSRLTLLEGTFSVEAEAVQDEIKILNRRGKSEERKFKEILLKTSITSILDMEPYWNYLMDNKASLETMVANSQRHVERMTQEREEERGRLRALVEEKGEENLLTPQEISYMSGKLALKAKELDISESNLGILENLVTAATNSVSLIAFNVMENSDILDIKPSNVAQYLDSCRETLEDIYHSLSGTSPHRPIMRKRTHIPTTESESPAPTNTGNFLQVSGNRARKHSRRVSNVSHI